jgi:LuxR family maltose regulon positive regulatory protein
MGARAPQAASATDRPPVPTVPRPRVEGFLNRTPDHPATLVVAPAGFGKTAAVASWAERARAAGTTVTWLPADRHDTIAAAVAEAVESPAQPGRSPVLVVDDAHLLCEQEVSELVAALSRSPDRIRLLLVSRTDLDWVPVASVLAGDVRTLPVDDLHFTPAEAAELVRMHLPDADGDEVAAVLEQADGWAAALVLGARALGAAGDISDARASLAATGRPTLDYLGHEVVESLPGDLVRVLVATCRLDQVTADEAVLLSGLPDAAELLDRAAAAGLLVTGYLDDGTHTWRYHPLLLDLLRRRTSPGRPDRAVVVEAHRRAASVYADRRDAERALRHARLGEDLDVQLRVIREFGAELIARRRPELVAEALDAIPAEIRAGHRGLLVLQATLLRALGDVDAAKHAADRALAAEAQDHTGPLARDLEAELATLELWQARFGWREAAPAIARAERVLGCRHTGPASAHALADVSPVRAHWLVLELAAFQTWLGDLDVASIHVQDATMYCHQVDLPALERAALAQRASLEMVAGAYQSARASAEAALAVERHRPPDTSSARAHLAIGWSHLHALELKEARRSLARFEATPRELLDHLLLVHGRLFRACVLASGGELPEAIRLLDHRGDVPELLPPHVQRDQQMVRLLLEISFGDLAGLERSARDMRALGLTAPAALAAAVRTGMSGEEARAGRMLDDIDTSSLDVQPALALAVAVMRAALLHRTGTASSLAAARESVPDLLGRAAPQRLLSTIAMGGVVSPGFLDLLEPHARAPDAHPFAVEAYAVLHGAVQTFPDLVPRHPDRGKTPLDDDPAVALTPREREVLEQLALGGGNADVARSLFVSENTVKTHLASIYRKLGVDRRIDALRVARARGLL